MGMTDSISVLHVEDESDFAEVVRIFLERADSRFEVHAVTSPAQARDFLANHTVDCIVSDFDMADETGLDLLEDVRKTDSMVPFILFTGKGSEEIASEAISAGVSDYLQKEAGTDQYAILANRINNLVSESRALTDLEHRVKQQELVASLGSDALADVPLDELFDRAMEILIEALDTEFSKLLEYQPDEDTFLLRAGTGWEHADIGEQVLPAQSHSQAGYTLQSSAPVVVESLDVENRFDGPQLLVEHGVTSGISALVGSATEPWGVLGAHSTEATSFTDQDVTFLQNVANILAHAIDRAERETALEGRTAELQAVIDGIDAAVWIRDSDNRYRLINETYRELFGIEGDVPVVGTSPREILGENLAEQFEVVDESVLTTGDPITLEETIETADGERDFLTRMTPLVEEGELTGVCGVAADVTEQKTRERQLAERVKELSAFKTAIEVLETVDSPLEATLHRFVETLPAGFQEPDHTDARIVFDGLEVTSSGFSPDSCMDSRHITVDDAGTLELEVVLHTDGTDQDGFIDEEQSLLDSLAIILKGYLERRTYLKTLERTERLLSNAERLGELGAWEIDPDTGRVHWTDGARRIHGVDEDFQPDFEELLSFVHADERERVRSTIGAAVDQDDPFEMTFNITSEDGCDRTVRVEGQSVSVDSNKRIRGLIQDITEHERRLKALSESEERLRIALDAGEMGMWELDLRSEESPVRSLRHDQIFGYEEPIDDWGFDRFIDHVHPDDRDHVRASFEEAFESGSWAFECRIHRVDGEERWIAPQGTFFYDESGDPATAIGIVQDITEEQELKTSLRERNDRLEAFARMVTHDIRNPLSVARGHLELHLEEHETTDLLEQVETALTRVEELTTDLATIARHGEIAEEQAPVSLAAVADDAWSLTDTREASLVTDTGRVIADASHLQGLLENLFRNAVGHGGRDVTVRVGAMDDGFYVEDTGVGIPPDERDRVFEDGYTTGYGGSGTGLTIVKRIAEAHGWEIGLTASPEGGARFEFTGVEVES